MSEHFDISLVYQGKECIFDAVLLTTAYSYRIKVRVEQLDIFYEPDEEQNFRAIVNYEDSGNTKLPAKALLEEISNALILLFKD